MLPRPCALCLARCGNHGYQVIVVCQPSTNSSRVIELDTAHKQSTSDHIAPPSLGLTATRTGQGESAISGAIVIKQVLGRPISLDSRIRSDSKCSRAGGRLGCAIAWRMDRWRVEME